MTYSILTLSRIINLIIKTVMITAASIRSRATHYATPETSVLRTLKPHTWSYRGTATEY